MNDFQFQNTTISDRCSGRRGQRLCGAAVQQRRVLYPRHWHLEPKTAAAELFTIRR